MPTIARQTLIYTPYDLSPENIICRYNKDILDSPVALKPGVTTQRSTVISAEWIDQRTRGNASISLSVTVSTAHESVASAEAHAEDVMLAMTLHAAGNLDIYSCHHGDQPMRSTRWRAIVDSAEPAGIAHDRVYSPLAAWIAISYQMTLTHPTPLI